MTKQVAIVNARVARALIRAFGMQAENQQRLHQGQSVAWPEEMFAQLIDDECIGENDIINAFRECCQPPEER